MSTLNSDELKQSIVNAFYNSVYPGDENIYDEGVEDPDMAERVLRFTGKHWRTVDSQTIRHLIDGFFFFTPEAFHFYLPALLVEYLDVNELDENIIHSLVFALSFAQRNDELYSPQQRKVINVYLQYLQKHPSNLFSDEMIDFWDVTSPDV